jgi:hypothetical protein
MTVSKLIYGILMLTWALWFGGLVALLLFVTRLFQASRPVAVEAAPVLFVTFANYQIVVGLLACAAGTLLAMMLRNRGYAVLTLVMLLAMVCALLNRGWTYEMENLRHAGQSGDAPFKALHAKTSIAYTSAAGLLLISGIGFILLPPPRRTGRETAGAKAFPGEPADRSTIAPAPPAHTQPH